MVHQIKTIAEKPMTLAEVKEEIARIKVRDGELGFRAAKAEEYLNAFVKLSAEDAAKLSTEITKLEVPRLSQEHVVKIANLLPKTVDELKVVLQGYAITLSKENMQKIVDVVVKYV